MADDKREKPDIVIAPGAWHKAAGFSKLVTLFIGLGFGCEIVAYPSIEVRPPIEDIQQDIKAVRNSVLWKLDDAGKDVVVICHSWGAYPVSGALEGLDEQSRREDGKSTWITKLVYIAPLIVPPGLSPYEAIGNTMHPLWAHEVSSVHIFLREGRTLISFSFSLRVIS